MRLRRRAAAVAAVIATLASAGCTDGVVARTVRLASPSDGSPNVTIPSSLAGTSTAPSGLPTGETIGVPAPVPAGALPSLLRSRVTGTLPRTGTVELGGMTLTGRRVHAVSDKDGKPYGPALLWTTDAVLDDAGAVWQVLARQFARSGLYPVVLQADSTEPDDGRPWLDGELDAVDQTDPSRVGTTAHVLATMYRDGQQGADPASVGVPYGSRFPGLAPVPAPDRGDVLDPAARDLPGRIGLVAVRRPADVPYTTGWSGSGSYFDSGYVTAVLRSWEDRFGAQLLRMGGDYIEVAVPHPATTMAQADRIAAEHLAFCPDEIYEGDYDTFPEYAKSLIGATTWYCDWYG